MNKILSHKIILNNGVEMPQFGLGTYKMTDENSTLEAIKYALKIGYRHIDTAEIYKNHHIIAKAIKESGVPREEIFITSKIWIKDFHDPETAFNKILADLEIEYLDLCLLHWFYPDWKKAYQLLEEKYAAKKVRAIGVSNFTEKHLQELFKVAKVKPTVNQIELHPQLPCLDLVDFSQKNGIAVTSWQTIMKGEVSKIDLLASLAEKYEVSAAQVALRWAWQKGIIIIPKSVTNQRIEENCDIANFELNSDEILAIDKLTPEVRLGPDPNRTNEF